MSPSIGGSIPRSLLAKAVAIAITFGVGAVAGAQSTTATISGVVRDQAKTALPMAEVIVTNTSLGVSTSSQSRVDGRFIISGLIAGGPYTVGVRHICYAIQSHDSLWLIIGEQRQLDFQLDREAVTLQATRVEADANRRIVTPGISTFITDSALHRLPAADRDMYGFVRLVPQ